MSVTEFSVWLTNVSFELGIFRHLCWLFVYKVSKCLFSAVNNEIDLDFGVEQDIEER